jgi:glutamate racemase
MANATAPVGVFDSGLGGLSVVREVRTALPEEDLLHFADCAYCPYSSRSPAEIAARCQMIAGELVVRGAKLLIVACNTACAVALPQFRARYPVPIVGLEPAVKPAARLTRSGRIAVLATPRTVASDRLACLVQAHAGGIAVEAVPAPGLVELVEAGQTRGEQVEWALHELIDPLVARGVDVLVLGCTHYPFLREAVERVAGPGVRVIDSGEAIARRTRDVLDRRGLLRSDQRAGALTLLTSGDAGRIGAVASRLLGSPVSVTRLALSPRFSLPGPPWSARLRAVRGLAEALRRVHRLDLGRVVLDRLVGLVDDVR